MDCTENRYDTRKLTEAELENGRRQSQLNFKLNHTPPNTDEYLQLLNELFGSIGENSVITAPLQGACFDLVNIGRNVFINSNLLAMARGGIDIGDDVQIASNVQLLTNNHDPYDRAVLICKPIIIEKGAWIGAGATILPGVHIGKHAIVGAASVVAHNVEDYEVVIGNPARAIRKLGAKKFTEAK